MEYGFKNSYASQILEVGAGNGYHKKFCNSKYDSYIESDIRESINGKIILLDAEKLSSFKDATFDRIIATCLLAHLNNPEAALKEWRRCVKNGGIISIYVPCEPGAALRLFRLLTTNIKSRIKKVDHYKFHYLEHRNYYINLNYLIHDAFRQDKIKIRKFPFGFLTWNMNFFYVYEISVKRK